MSDLPTEILIQISILASFHDSTAPGKFSMVCSRWRAIVHGLPQIWTRLHYRPHVPVALWTKQVDMYFSRSDTLPVEVDLDLDSERGEDAFPLVAPLLVYHSRWESAGLRINGNPIPNMPTGYANEDGMLILARRAYASGPLNALALASCKSAGTIPSLSVNANKIRPCQTYLPFSKISIVEPFDVSQSQETTNGDTPLTVVISYLIHCPQLTTFTVSSFSGEYLIQPIIRPPIALPGITSITLNCWSTTPTLLSSLSVPNLVELRLYQRGMYAMGKLPPESGTPDPDSEEVDPREPPASAAARIMGSSIKRLLKQSPGIRLRRLSLDKVVVRRSDYDYFFNHLHDLEELDIQFTNIPDSAFGLLKSKERLPKLQSLTLLMCSYVSSGVIVAALVGRQGTLKSILTDRLNLTRKHERQLQNAFGEGFSLRLWGMLA